MDIYLPTQAEILKACRVPEPTGWMPPGTERPLTAGTRSLRRMTGED